MIVHSETHLSAEETFLPFGNERFAFVGIRVVVVKTTSACVSACWETSEAMTVQTAGTHMQQVIILVVMLQNDFGESLTL